MEGFYIVYLFATDGSAVRPIDRHAPLEEFARIAPQVPVSAS
jgi:hypothetical protein